MQLLSTFIHTYMTDLPKYMSYDNTTNRYLIRRRHSDGDKRVRCKTFEEAVQVYEQMTEQYPPPSFQKQSQEERAAKRYSLTHRPEYMQKARERKAQKVQCKRCGSFTSRGGLARHERTKKCLRSTIPEESL